MINTIDIIYISNKQFTVVCLYLKKKKLANCIIQFNLQNSYIALLLLHSTYPIPTSSFNFLSRSHNLCMMAANERQGGEHDTILHLLNFFPIYFDIIFAKYKNPYLLTVEKMFLIYINIQKNNIIQKNIILKCYCLKNHLNHIFYGKISYFLFD